VSSSRDFHLQRKVNVHVINVHVTLYTVYNNNDDNNNNYYDQ